MTSSDLLLEWLDRRLDSDAVAWLREQRRLLAGGAPARTLHLAFGQALRRAGRAPLSLTTSEQAAAFGVHPGWDLRDWTLEQAARAVLLGAAPSSPKTVKAVLDLFQTADLGEHVALVRALFLLPDAPALLHIAREGIRSNMGDVFRAVTQYNPYPAEHFDEIAWNQMIVKCLFVELPLRGIHGLDARTNAELARMITGLARERWAAGRAISPEAWRCVAPFAPSGGDESAALRDAFARTPADRLGAALALWKTGNDEARAFVAAAAPDLVSALGAGTITWENWEHHDQA